jgi:hypothetical protein
VLNGLTYCNWWPMAMQHNSMGDGFWQILPNQTRSLFETNLFSLFGRSLTASQQTGVYRAMMGEAERLSADRDFAFTLVHLPVPHAPHAYNRKTGTFTLKFSDRRIYWQPRFARPHSGRVEARWRTPVSGIRPSIHQRSWISRLEALDGKRSADSVYPQTGVTEDAIAYTREFNTVLTADLLMDMLLGDRRRCVGRLAWLDRNRTRRLG